MPKGIMNTMAMAAYVDLIQTAEYAIPKGDDDWSDPMSIDLWKKAMLGGKYCLGYDMDSVFVLITLKGHEEGYKIDKCWIASDAEYEKYEHEYGLWRQTLQDYFDVFE